MKLSFKEYADKVRACWLGKNIGGTIGAPFEGVRGVYDIDYYTHDLSKGVLPNDDLDLQLIWLNVAEKYGKALNAEILGEYWLSYIVADWSEYGTGKNNMRYGIAPPISGWYKNPHKDSCGCFIRSEIWACLTPGRPDLAVKFAYEDAICDHADEGMYGEIFCASLESAAFVESDIRKLTEIGLSYIPSECAIARAVKRVYECYEKGLTWKEARKVILIEFPCSFGEAFGYREDFEPEADIPPSNIGYDAPANIAIMMIGLVYGEGDFSKTICIATGCCEDADCTAGTSGAIIGIIGGRKVIDQKWLDPIGDEIKTVSVDCTKDRISLPATVTELTDRIIRLVPTFMNGHFDFNEQGVIEFSTRDDLFVQPIQIGRTAYTDYVDTIRISPVRVRKSNALYEINVIYDGTLTVRENEPKKFEIVIENKFRCQQWVEFTLHMPDEWLSSKGRVFCVNANQYQAGDAYTKTSLTITPQTINRGRYDLALEVKSNGRLQTMFIPIVLLADED